MKHNNMHLQRSIDMAHDLISLADQGEAESCDDSCIALYGVVRDCGYRIKVQAERERALHQSRGVWVEEGGRARA
jgi:hypothetical protein